MSDRIYFESTEFKVDEHEEQRRGRSSGTRCVVIGTLLMVMVGCAVWAQKSYSKADTRVTLAAIKREASNTHKYVVLFFTDTTCIPCQRMRSETLNHSTVVSAMERQFILCEVDPDFPGYDTIAMQYDVTTAPALRITTADGDLLSDIDGQPLSADGRLDSMQVLDLLERTTRNRKERRRPTTDAKLTRSTPQDSGTLEPDDKSLSASADASASGTPE